MLQVLTDTSYAREDAVPNRGAQAKLKFSLAPHFSAVIISDYMFRDQ